MKSHWWFAVQFQHGFLLPFISITVTLHHHKIRFYNCPVVVNWSENHIYQVEWQATLLLWLSTMCRNSSAANQFMKLLWAPHLLVMLKKPGDQGWRQRWKLRGRVTGGGSFHYYHSGLSRLQGAEISKPIRNHILTKGRFVSSLTKSPYVTG